MTIKRGNFKEKLKYPTMCFVDQVFEVIWSAKPARHSIQICDLHGEGDALL